MGAGSYLLLMSSAVIAWSLATIYWSRALAMEARINLSSFNFAVSAFGVALGIVFYAASARRLRDLNFPAWSVKILAFPLLGVIVLPVLGFLSGPRWANDYGDAPRPSSFTKTAIAVVLFFVAVGVSYSALTSYYEARHVLLKALVD